MQTARTTQDEPRIEILERYFKKYPEAPREVIVKGDMLTLGQWFTDAALAATAGSMVKSYRLFSYDRISMSEMKRKENRRVPEHMMILGGMYGLRPVNIQVSLDPNSPYVVDVVDGRVVLTAEGRTLCEIRYPRAPKYYSLALGDATPYHEIIAFGYFITAFRACQYWGPKEECKFCDINENVRQMRRSRDFTLNAPVKRVEDVMEVAEAIGREQVEQDGGYPTPLSLLVSGGTITEKLHGKTEDEFYGPYVEAVKWGGPRRVVGLQTNAKPKKVLRWYRSLGLDNHHADMEVWDRRLFEWLCPGKAKLVGWDNWVRWLIESVDVFPDGETKPLFVAGAEMAQPHGFKTVDEAVGSTTEGMDYLMKHGVLPRFQHWRREFGSDLVKSHPQPPIPLDYFIRCTGNRYELWKRYRMPLPMSGRLLKPLRYIGVSHGTYEDYILLKENAYPANIVDIVNEASLPAGLPA